MGQPGNSTPERLRRVRVVSANANTTSAIDVANTTTAIDVAVRTFVCIAAFSAARGTSHHHVRKRVCHQSQRTRIASTRRSGRMSRPLRKADANNVVYSWKWQRLARRHASTAVPPCGSRWQHNLAITRQKIDGSQSSSGESGEDVGRPERGPPAQLAP